MATVTYELRLREKGRATWLTIETKEFPDKDGAISYAHDSALAWVTSDMNRGFTFMVSTDSDDKNCLIYSVWNRDNEYICKYTARWE